MLTSNQQEVFFDNLENLCCCQFQVIKSRVVSKGKWSISFSKKENVPNFLCLVTCCPLVHPAKPTSQAPYRRRSLLKFKTDPSVSLLPWTKPPSIMFQENGASLFEAANIKSLVASWKRQVQSKVTRKTEVWNRCYKKRFWFFCYQRYFCIGLPMLSKTPYSRAMNRMMRLLTPDKWSPKSFSLSKDDWTDSKLLTATTILA